MKALILAAGFGSRLMPLTKDIPKCLVQYKQKAILEYALCALRESGITDIGIVGGYKFEVLEQYAKTHGINYIFRNPHFAKTNMVATLFCAEGFLTKCVNEQEGVLISYADIIYQKELVEAMKSYKGDFGIAIDMNWRALWERRFTDVLSDAETLKLQGDIIIELGKKPKNIDEIQGQYMGLFSFSAEFLPKVIGFYHHLNTQVLYDGKDFDNMYMTSFLQGLIDAGFEAHCIKNIWKWLEIDCVSDLEV